MCWLYQAPQSNNNYTGLYWGWAVPGAVRGQKKRPRAGAMYQARKAEPVVRLRVQDAGGRGRWSGSRNRLSWQPGKEPRLVDDE